MDITISWFVVKKLRRQVIKDKSVSMVAQYLHEVTLDSIFCGCLILAILVTSQKIAYAKLNLNYTLKQ